MINRVTQLRQARQYYQSIWRGLLGTFLGVSIMVAHAQSQSLPLLVSPKIKPFLQTVIDKKDATVFTIKGLSQKQLEYWRLTKVSPKFNLLFSPAYDSQFVLFSPTQPQVIFPSQNRMYLMDIASRKIIREYKKHRKNLSFAVLSGDGKSLLSYAADKQLLLWNLDTHQIIQKLSITDAAHGISSHRTRSIGFNRKNNKLKKNKIHAIALNQLGLLAFAGDNNGYIYVWNTANGELRHKWLVHNKPIRSIALTHNNRYILVGSDRQILELIDYVNGNRLHSFIGHTAEIVQVAVSKNRAASLDRQGQVIVWDLTQYKMIQAFPPQKEIKTIALNSDGSVLFTAGTQSQIDLWDIDHETLVRPPFVYESNHAIQHMSLSGDDNAITFVDQKNNIVLLQFPPIVQKLDRKISLSHVWEGVEQLIAAQKEERIGPPIAQPDLPTYQPPAKSAFESQAAYEKRLERERQAKVNPLLDDYHRQVITRNQRIDKSNQYYGDEEWTLLRRHYFVKVFADTYGHPLIQAIEHKDNMPSYDPESQQMYAQLYFSDNTPLELQHRIAIEVPEGEPAQLFYQALRKGQMGVALTMKFFDGSQRIDLVKAQVSLHDRIYIGKPVHTSIKNKNDPYKLVSDERHNFFTLPKTRLHKKRSAPSPLPSSKNTAHRFSKQPTEIIDEPWMKYKNGHLNHDDAQKYFPGGASLIRWAPQPDNQTNPTVHIQHSDTYVQPNDDNALHTTDDAVYEWIPISFPAQ